MYEELVKRLRNDAREQECLLHVCNSTMNSAEAADAIETLEKQLAETDAIAEHEHCRYIETLGECDGMEARCKIVEKQLAEKESEIVRIRNSWSNTISDLSGVAAERDKYKASLDQIIRCAACKYSEPFPTDPRVLICANPKWVPTGDGRGVEEPYVKPDDYCSFGEAEDDEMDD